ncbi:class I adenylate-forming enzyme family protein [Streptomyces finlayi]|nr:class I adenylate-forming enzyme family protein [Streptomyces finlayi]
MPAAATRPLTAAHAARYLATRVTSTMRTGSVPVTYESAHEALEQSKLPAGSVVVISVSSPTAQLNLFWAAHHLDLVPVLIPRSTARHRIRETANALGAAALVTLIPGAAPLQGSPLAVTRWHPASPQRHHRGTVILMTSGTSGPPSGCLHHIDSLYANARLHARAIGLRSTDTMLINLPLHYSFTLVSQALAAMACDTQLVLSEQAFTPEGYRSTLQRHHVTVSSLLPTLARSLLYDDGRLPGSLRTLTVGGDALEAVHVRELLRRHPQGELYLTYGLTEAGPRVATLAAHQEPSERHTSAGKPLPGITTRIGGTAGPGIRQGAGELIVTTPTAILRRIGEPTGRCPGQVAPNTVATGDIFETDGEGYLYFRGRQSDFLRLNGEEISLRWVREVVGSLPGVLHVRAETFSTSPARAAVPVRHYRLHVRAVEATYELRAQIERRLREVLMRTECPRELVLTD